MKTLTAIVIGAGLRGTAYTAKMKEMGDAYRIVAVAAPLKAVLSALKRLTEYPMTDAITAGRISLPNPK